MLDGFLGVLRDRLVEVLRDGHADAGPPKAVVAVGSDAESIKLVENAVSILLVNVQEERVMRSADPYTRRADSQVHRVNPELRLTAFVLLIARFRETMTCWSHLSKVLEYFREHRVIECKGQRLSFEFMSQNFNDLNELWSMLKIPLQPSLLYRVNLLVLRDGKPKPAHLIEPKKIEVDVMPREFEGAEWLADLRRYVPDYDVGAVERIVRYCGIGLHTLGASLVSFDDPKEWGPVEKFCRRLLASDSSSEDGEDRIRDAIERVRDRVGDTANRVVVYYLLAEDLGKFGELGSRLGRKRG